MRRLKELPQLVLAAQVVDAIVRTQHRVHLPVQVQLAHILLYKGDHRPGLAGLLAGLEKHIGSLHAGADADIVVLDSSAKPAMEYRMRTAKSLMEELFILQTMGDDRCVAEVYVAGKAMKAKNAKRAAAPGRPAI